MFNALALADLNTANAGAYVVIEDASTVTGVVRVPILVAAAQVTVTALGANNTTGDLRVVIEYDLLT